MPQKSIRWEGNPDHPALIMTATGEVVTYAELENWSRPAANWLFDAGLRSGDVVVVLSDNSSWILDIYRATQRSGLYLMPTNCRLDHGEVDYMLGNSGAAALFVGRGALKTARTINEHERLERRVCLEGDLAGYETYEQALKTARATLPSSQPRGAHMLYSSGTTGRPKGMRHALPKRQVPILAIQSCRRFRRILASMRGQSICALLISIMPRHCEPAQPSKRWVAVALANKFARIAWRLMISGGVYNRPVAGMPT